jgi:serine/threonine-protein kinase
MATVYLGRIVGEGGFERLVALKLMHPHIANDPDFVGMFLDEARLAARIRHPNVVGTIDIQKTSDSLFIVMEYVDGPTLQEIRKHLKTKNEQIPLGVTIRIFLDILNGLQEAHELEDDDGHMLNLVHRDVSPHNILIGTDGVAKLTDFGVAKAEARISSTRGGQLKGKIAYMPPEQILTEPVSRRADVYSAGVCLWEALVGKRLFRAPNDGAMVHMILEGMAAPPSKYVDDVPKPIEEVVMKAIARRSEGRYGEALDMADALEAAARASGIRIPRAREVGGFIKEVKGTLGEAAPSGKSLTPVSDVSDRVDSDVHDDGISQPSMPSIGTGPAMPQAFDAGRAPKPKPKRLGPPPIPDIGSDMNLPPLATGGAPSRPQAPPPVASQHEMSKPAIMPRPSYPRAEVDDEATTVMPLAETFDHSQPSAVTSPTSPTSPTHTEATYTLQPPSSKHGVIAVGVAGLLALGVILAVLLGAPDNDTTPTPAATSPLFPSDDKTATVDEPPAKTPIADTSSERPRPTTPDAGAAPQPTSAAPQPSSAITPKPKPDLVQPPPYIPPKPKPKTQPPPQPTTKPTTTRPREL